MCRFYTENMSTFSTDEVAELAAVAHIDMNDEEIRKLAEDLDPLAEWIKKISDADIEGVPPTTNPLSLTNVLREDVVGETLDRDEVLAQAPEAEAGMFQVPQILGEE
jgi:aspartyl-tRNA(Asn)/glutamyl-tRNA(Gln) amidotransferase subunit C